MGDRENVYCISDTDEQGGSQIGLCRSMEFLGVFCRSVFSEKRRPTM
jgi:hypothetical protein